MEKFFKKKQLRETKTKGGGGGQVKNLRFSPIGLLK